METSLIRTIEEHVPRLSAAEARVAAAILSDPDLVVGSSIAVIARDAQVSQPTVLRFCRAVGCAGFRDFKLKLAQSRVARPWFVHKGIDETDAASVYAHKVLDSTLDTIVRIRGSLNHVAIEQAVDALARAVDTGRIVFFGLGASGAVAHDAACKFFFLVTQCHAYADGHMQHMCAPTLGPDDVVVAISGTGKTRDLVRNARLARRSGATVIAITSPGSPLADVASVLVAADVRENTDVYTPSTSRIVHLLIVDILAVGVALRFSRRTEARVERIKRIVRASRLQGGENLAYDI